MITFTTILQVTYVNPIVLLACPEYQRIIIFKHNSHFINCTVSHKRLRTQSRTERFILRAGEFLSCQVKIFNLYVHVYIVFSSQCHQVR